jgi:hypothetical protein
MRVRAVVAYSGAAALAAPFLRLLRRSPQERERRRRELIQARGRVIEGYATGFRDGSIEYSYEWRGVRYEASQDLSDLIANATVCDDYAGPGDGQVLEGSAGEFDRPEREMERHPRNTRYALACRYQHPLSEPQKPLMWGGNSSRLRTFVEGTIPCTLDVGWRPALEAVQSDR